MARIGLLRVLTGALHVGVRQLSLSILFALRPFFQLGLFSGGGGCPRLVPLVRFAAGLGPPLRRLLVAERLGTFAHIRDPGIVLGACARLRHWFILIWFRLPAARREPVKAAALAGLKAQYDRAYQRLRYLRSRGELHRMEELRLSRLLREAWTVLLAQPAPLQGSGCVPLGA